MFQHLVSCSHYDRYYFWHSMHIPVKDVSSLFSKLKIDFCLLFMFQHLMFRQSLPSWENSFVIVLNKISSLFLHMFNHLVFHHFSSIIVFYIQCMLWHQVCYKVITLKMVIYTRGNKLNEININKSNKCHQSQTITQ